ncbi:MAG: hypothetical protein NC548_61355 [Lachnospiraceae bacterium]|nr:hypothetical protein [Lachnospiraceae bacterium]
MKKEKRISGYQVRSADLEGISFEGHSLEEYKRWCRKGDVIVSTYKKRSGLRIILTFGKWIHLWSFRPRWKELEMGWFYIRWEWIYIDKPIEVVYKNE